MRIVILILTIALISVPLAACSGQSTEPTTMSVSSDMTHIGNYDVERINQLVLAANAANIPYELSAPYGEGCTQAADCTWDKDDQAFHIEEGSEQALWESWQALYCVSGSSDSWCIPDDN